MNEQKAKERIKSLEVEQARLEAQRPLFDEFEAVHEDRKLNNARKLRNLKHRLDQQEQTL